MATGTIKKVFCEKGYGYISADDGTDCHFFLNKVLGGTELEPGDFVTFSTKETPKGRTAFNIAKSGTAASDNSPVKTSQSKTANSTTNLSSPKGKFAPRSSEAAYRFVNRAAGKQHPAAFHDRLLTNRFDVAFEIAWRTATPTAINPAISARRLPEGMQCTDDRFKGYQRGWLRMGGHLAISPFTVKGAMANGVANLLGGCYRMIDPENAGEVEKRPLHSDAIPTGNQLCTSVHELCPRCTLFGMVCKDEADSVGFGGRFRSSALVNDIVLHMEHGSRDFSSFLRGMNSVRVEEWHNPDGLPVTSMELLPVTMTSNPYGKYTRAKYFNDDGTIRGAKYFPHEALQSARNIKGVDQKRVKHEHRTFAEVCRPGTVFTGTVGAENCSAEEVAAMITLLHEPVFGHGFKLGIGKYFGLGSVTSTISKVWVRSCDCYTWRSIPVLPSMDTPLKLVETIGVIIPEIHYFVDKLSVSPGINLLQGRSAATVSPVVKESVGTGAFAAAFAKARQTK